MLIPTIHFAGNCNEVIEFYKQTIGAEVQMIAHAKDAPADLGVSPDFVMHSVIAIGDGQVSMTDGAETPLNTGNYSFMLTKNTVAEVEALFEKLLVGGKVVAPLGPVFWASMYGMVEDQFGVTWQVMTMDGM